MAERRTRVVRPWLWALGGLVGVLLLAFALVVGPWLLTRHPQKGLTSEQALKAMSDVRTTLVQALAGFAVAGGLVVTYRTFRQNQVEQDRTYALRLGEQVNALYTKAVEQLGHDQAPVRLGALYSLVHLAQANPNQRQTVVDVLCAYLRMPYAPPGSAPPNLRQTVVDVLSAYLRMPYAPPGSAPPNLRQTVVDVLSAYLGMPYAPPGSAPPTIRRDAAQELQVRLTAQRLLADHLHVPSGVSGRDAQDRPPSPDETFWPEISLDLTGAALIDLDLTEASVVVARFDRATFSGDASFSEATFTGETSFSEATFTGETSFSEATFTGGTSFSEATFTGDVLFGKATFSGRPWFDGTTFSRPVWFEGARVLDLNKGWVEQGSAFEWNISGWILRPDEDDPTRGTLVPRPPYWMDDDQLFGGGTRVMPVSPSDWMDYMFGNRVTPVSPSDDVGGVTP
ncbi:pentapeptide repeat protein [Micromonospora kangleipakensis]|uniref:Pentapeptide repeat protein n=1 Tax=Micromonospora kangleipakensis TaxID=1077942 RepID=A0A4Q8BJ91_9ACTN|nr:pentapeptide repeat-containing protein [Micromonospora kangleipakensis]RZU77615.1 pentapeptide repeat protein [Micromonospora kangleipakensis]